MSILGVFSSSKRWPKVPSDGLQVYLDASIADSYTGSGTQWRDISGNNRHFNWSSTSFVSNAGLSYFNTSGRTATGPASNALGLTSSGDYTIITLSYANSASQNTALRIWKDGVDDGAQRAVSMHLIYSDSTIYWDQGGCCAADTRTSINASGQLNAYRMWTLRRGSDGRKIFRGTSLLTTNTTAPANIAPNSTAAVLNLQQPGLNWDARINAFIIYNRAISDVELASIYNYYASRGLTN